jgi:riboflavin synthase
MFTGIVEAVGTVRTLQTVGDGVTLSLASVEVLDGTALGDSISVDGTCLTVTSLDAAGFEVGLSPETLRLTTLGDVRPGSRVNLERAVRAGDRMGGHYVQGHVDGVGRITGVRPEGDSQVVTFEFPPQMGRYIVQKGFIAVDGASLTVTARTDATFSVALVAYTQDHIALLDKGIGGRVNLEVDIIAKYVESMLRSEELTGDQPETHVSLRS